MKLGVSKSADFGVSQLHWERCCMCLETEELLQLYSCEK